MRRLAAALRPFIAPVGVEAFEGLRREHTPKCRLYYASGGATKDRDRCHPVDCGADAHSALLAQCTAAYAAALAEVEVLRRERDAIEKWARTAFATVNEICNDEMAEQIGEEKRMALDLMARLMVRADRQLTENIAALTARRARGGGQ